MTCSLRARRLRLLSRPGAGAIVPTNVPHHVRLAAGELRCRLAVIDGPPKIFGDSQPFREQAAAEGGHRYKNRTVLPETSTAEGRDFALKRERYPPRYPIPHPGEGVKVHQVRTFLGCTLQ